MQIGFLERVGAAFGIFAVRFASSMHYLQALLRKDDGSNPSFKARGVGSMKMSCSHPVKYLYDYVVSTIDKGCT